MDMSAAPGPPVRTGKRKRGAGPLGEQPTTHVVDQGARSDPAGIRAEDGASERCPAEPTAKQTNEGGRPASLKKRASSAIAPVECLVGWPERFRQLDRTHRALNLVFTFCCTRKHLATTFDTIRSAVESHTRRELLVEDVAAVVALRPDGANFAYVDEVMLQIDIQGAERDDTFKTAGRVRGRGSQGFAPDSSVGGITGREELGAAGHPDDIAPSGKEVLYFEFVDGDLKRQVQSRKTGQPTRPTRRLRDEDLKMPVFSQKQMTELIERRNQKFANAVSMFLNRCVAEGLDPVETLRRETEAYIPAPSPPPDAAPPPGTSTLPETIPKERKSIPEIVEELKQSSWYTGQIVPDGHRVFDAVEPSYGDLSFLLSQDLVNALYNAKGITQFFAHQAEAINSLHDNHHVVVSTSTSSGKSLIYQLPVLYALEKDHDTRAMYIFPTKALAQDQRRSLRELLGFMPGLGDVLVETFDGDTPMSERNMIRDEARIIFTNPDMLHITILPQEERWRTFLKNLQYVVGGSKPNAADVK